NHSDLFARPIVITKADFRFVVAEQLRERGIEADIVLEPMRRDSGPAVAVVAGLVRPRDADALVLWVCARALIHKTSDVFGDCEIAMHWSWCLPPIISFESLKISVTSAGTPPQPPPRVAS